jgi:hypothetical protein
MRQKDREGGLGLLNVPLIGEKPKRMDRIEGT